MKFFKLTHMSIKLNANNFTGKFPNGQKYRVVPNETPNEVVVKLDVLTYDGWETESTFCASFGYALYGTREDALITTLTEVEKAYELQLIKSKLQTVA